MSEQTSNTNPEITNQTINVATPAEAAGVELPSDTRMVIGTFSHSEQGFQRKGNLVTLPDSKTPVDFHGSVRFKNPDGGFVDVGEVVGSDGSRGYAAVGWREDDQGRYEIADAAPLTPGRAVSLGKRGFVPGVLEGDALSVGLGAGGTLGVRRPEGSPAWSIQSLGRPEDFASQAQPSSKPSRNLGDPNPGERAVAIDPQTGDRIRVIERPPLTPEAQRQQLGAMAAGDAVEAPSTRPRRRKRTQERYRTR